MNFENISNCYSNFNRPIVPFKLKRFVSASSQIQDKNNSQNQTSFLICNDTGDNISNYYSEICESRSNNNRDYSSSSDEDMVIVCEVPKKRKKKVTSIPQKLKVDSANEKTINRAMKYAQCDELESLKDLIENGLSVNTTDSFGWTLLMVASYAGARNVVKYLISKEARRGKRDSKGNTALFLASKNNHIHIVNLLIKSNKESTTQDIHPVDEEISEQRIESHFCDVCNMTPSCSIREHETSIAHLFRMGSSNTRPMYGIPRSNVGFQMLLHQGWNDTEGLGPEGEGRIYPIKSSEKQDRLGLGHNSKDNPKNFGKEKAKPISIKKIKHFEKTKHLEKQKETYFRRMLNEPEF